MAITMRQRRKLPSSDFALPGKGTGKGGKGPGSYPIDTPGRARSALSRGAQNATPAEQATIKRKVKAKYPSIDVGGKGGKGGNSNGNPGNPRRLPPRRPPNGHTKQPDRSSERWETRDARGGRGRDDRIAGELSRRLEERNRARR